MSILWFVSTWIAAWAACWFGLSRWWPSRRCRVGLDGAVAAVYGADASTGRIVIEGRPVRDGRGWEWRTFKPARWWRLSGAREWAPYIATVVAFVVDWIVSW